MNILGLDTNKIYKIENDKAGDPTLVKALNEKSIQNLNILIKQISHLYMPRYFLNEKNADIPVIDATKESLAFYNVLLIKPGGWL